MSESAKAGEGPTALTHIEEVCIAERFISLTTYPPVPLYRSHLPPDHNPQGTNYMLFLTHLVAQAPYHHHAANPGYQPHTNVFFPLFPTKHLSPLPYHLPEALLSRTATFPHITALISVCHLQPSTTAFPTLPSSYHSDSAMPPSNHPPPKYLLSTAPLPPASTQTLPTSPPDIPHTTTQLPSTPAPSLTTSPPGRSLPSTSTLSSYTAKYTDNQ